MSGMWEKYFWLSFLRSVRILNVSNIHALSAIKVNIMQICRNKFLYIMMFFSTFSSIFLVFFLPAFVFCTIAWHWRSKTSYFDVVATICKNICFIFPTKKFHWYESISFPRRTFKEGFSRYWKQIAINGNKGSFWQKRQEYIFKKNVHNPNWGKEWEHHWTSEQKWKWVKWVR